MRVTMNILAGLAGLYSLLIFIRIILSWFNGLNYGKPAEIITRVTDPYLNWWRRIPGLQIGFLDLSPIAAMTALSIVQTIFSSIARYGKMSPRIILAVCVSALWSAVSFVLGFCVVILVLRFIAFAANLNTYGGFWRIIDSFSRPVLYRIQRIIFGRRIVKYTTGIVVSIIVLALVWTGGRIAVRLLTELLISVPVEVLSAIKGVAQDL